MNIGEVAQTIGLPSKTIRYYEDVGLLHPTRTSNGYRDFSGDDLHKLAFIARARSLGFSVEECRTLLSLYEDRNRSSADVRAIAEKHLESLERKLAELASLKSLLQDLVDRCHGDKRPECPILDDLGGETRAVHEAARPGRRRMS